MANKPSLTPNNLLRARKILFLVTSLLEKKNIPYHLEGGTLLGLVRDQELLPWDHDVDISIPEKYVPDFLKLRLQLFLMGYKVSIRKSKLTLGPIQKNQYSIFKIKPLGGYIMQWLKPHHVNNLIVLDVFVKVPDNTHTYWQAKGKVMRVENKYYESFETLKYRGENLRTPNQFEAYLTEKYGNWKIPVKKWDCSVDERTIVKE